MLHTTLHFDGGDIDKYNDSPLGRNKIVFGSKRRFMSPDINMHYGQSFQVVGLTTGDRAFDDSMRFATTNREQFCVNRTRFGTHVKKKNKSVRQR